MKVIAKTLLPTACALRRALVAWLVFSFVATQALGLIHGITHAPGAGSGLGAGQGSGHVTVPAAHDQPARGAGAGWMDGLFSHDSGGADCRLYDQVGHGDAMPGVPALVLPSVPPVHVFLFFQGEAVARWAALFDARGPPSSR